MLVHSSSLFHINTYYPQIITGNTYDKFYIIIKSKVTILQEDNVKFGNLLRKGKRPDIKTYVIKHVSERSEGYVFYYIRFYAKTEKGAERSFSVLEGPSPFLLFFI